MIDNAEWLLSLNYVAFLREVGRHISVNQMIQRDSVKMRLEREHHLSFLEFNYMVLQAYDFVELARRTRLPAPARRFGPVGQHRLRHRPRPQARRRRAVRRHLAADHDVVRREDGQDRRRRGLAQRRSGLALPVLAVLAEHRGRRRRPLPEALHRAAARRDRTPRRPSTAPRSTRRRRSWRPRRLPSSMVAPPPMKPPMPPGAPSRKGPRPTRSRPSPFPTSELEAGAAVLGLFVRAGLVASNGEARRQIRGGGLRVNDVAVADERATVSSATFRPERSSCRSAGRSTFSSSRSDWARTPSINGTRRSSGRFPEPPPTAG